MSRALTNNVVPGNSRDIDNYLSNKEKYYTQVYYKKSYENGHETIKGAFYSVSKTKTLNAPKVIDDRVYYTNNAIDSFQSYRKSDIDNIRFLKKVLFFVICLVLIFFVIDFLKMYYKVKRQNEIDLTQCYKEYQENECYNDTMLGPQREEYCLERKKCIETSTTYIHVVIITYFKSIISHSFSNMNLINIILFIFALVFIVKNLIK